LDIGPHEIFGIFLKHIVDLIEQVVGLRGKLLTTLLPSGCTTDSAIILAAAAATLGLFLSHRCLLISSAA